MLVVSKKKLVNCVFSVLSDLDVGEIVVLIFGLLEVKKCLSMSDVCLIDYY